MSTCDQKSWYQTQTRIIYYLQPKGTHKCNFEIFKVCCNIAIICYSIMLSLGYTLFRWHPWTTDYGYATTLKNFSCACIFERVTETHGVEQNMHAAISVISADRECTGWLAEDYRQAGKAELWIPASMKGGSRVVIYSCEQPGWALGQGLLHEEVSIPQMKVIFKGI